VKCRYNENYILPALPEWDDSNYPYAIILTRTNIAFDYWLVYSSSPFTAATMDGNTIIAFDTDTNMYCFTYSVSDDEATWKNGRVYDPQEDENVLAYYFDPSKVSYVWTNTDITDGSDNVVYAASDPIPIIETDYLMSWLTGYILGISGKPYPFAKKKLVGYSYNGMVLPELPEWDKTTMPYVVMYKDAWERIYVFYTKYANKQASPSISVSGTYNVRVGEPYKEYRCEDGNWWIYADHSDAIDVEFSHSINIETRVIWTNFDIFTPDGDLIFAASDPIPVYE
jgi:hypothetical protein